MIGATIKTKLTSINYCSGMKKKNHDELMRQLTKMFLYMNHNLLVENLENQGRNNNDNKVQRIY